MNCCSSSPHGFDDIPNRRVASRRPLSRQAGAVYVEFLIAFFPVLTVFFGVLQIAELQLAGIGVRHAAFVAARSGSVIFSSPDDARTSQSGDVTSTRSEVVRKLAARIVSRYLLTTSIDLGNPSDVAIRFLAKDGTLATRYGFGEDFVRAELTLKYRCTWPIVDRVACGPTGQRSIVRVGTVPTQWYRLPQFRPVPLPWTTELPATP